MTDPFSVSAGIAGIASLGITVCSGLLKYYSSYRDAHEDVASAYSRIEGLFETFKSINTNLQNPLFSREAVDRVTASLVSCAGGVEKLREKLDKAKITKPGGTAVLRRAQWPFREQTVVKLRLIVSDLCNNLSLAIGAFQIDVGATSLEKVQNIDRALQNAEGSRIIQWLSPINARAKQSDALKRRSGETGKWFLENPEFLKWLCGSTKVLWCPGIPGAGKTTLTSIIVNHLEQTLKSEMVGVVCVYCTYNDPLQTTCHFLGSILQQLAQHKPLLLPELKSYYHSQQGSVTQLSTPKTIAELLQKQIQQFERVLVVIDALDECTESGNTRKTFLDEISNLGPKTQLLITSRHEASIGSRFRAESQIEILAHDDDVDTFIRTYFRENDQLRELLEDSPQIQEDAVESLRDKTRGMFLLPVLHMDSLAGADNLRDFKESLERLPDDLDSMYDDVMKRIHSQSPAKTKRAEQVLRWLSCAERLLTIDELCYALAIRPGDTELVLEAVPKPKLLLSICCGLVVIDHERQAFRFVHYTTEEYFKKNQKYCGPDAHGYITETLISCFNFPTFTNAFEAFKAGELPQRVPWRVYHTGLETVYGGYFRKQIVNSELTNEFLLYTLEHWGDHARQFLDMHDRSMDEDESDTSPVRVNRTSEAIEASRVRLNIMRFFEAKKAEIRFAAQELYTEVTALMAVAGFGILAAVNLYLDQGDSLNDVDSAERTAIHYAAPYGYDAVVRRLLSHPAINLDAVDELGTSALEYALDSGHVSTAALLLGKAAFLPYGNRLSSNFKNCFSGYSDKQAQESFQFLVDHICEPNLQEEFANSAFFGLLKLGYAGAVDHLLKTWHIEADTRQSGFIKAIRRNQFKIIEILLRCGVSINDYQGAASTPLSGAVQKQSPRSVYWLLSHAADPNICDYHGQNPLHSLPNGDAKKVDFMVKALVAKGADLEAKTMLGLSPLDTAIRRGLFSNAEILLKYGADINALPDDFPTECGFFANDLDLPEVLAFIADAQQHPRIPVKAVWPDTLPPDLDE